MNASVIAALISSAAAVLAAIPPVIMLLWKMIREPPPGAEPGNLRLTGTALFQLSYGGMFIEFRELDSNQRAPGPKPGRDACNPPRIEEPANGIEPMTSRLQDGRSAN